MSDLTSWLHEFADACEIVAAGRWPGPRTAARLREVADALAAAPLQAEIEALRAEVERLKALVRSVGYETLDRAEQAEALAERLAEALRGMMDEYEALHAEYDLGDCQATVDARAALRDHDQEGNDHE